MRRKCFFALSSRAGSTSGWLVASLHNWSMKVLKCAPHERTVITRRWDRSLHSLCSPVLSSNCPLSLMNDIWKKWKFALWLYAFTFGAMYKGAAVYRKKILNLCCRSGCVRLTFLLPLLHHTCMPGTPAPAPVYAPAELFPKTKFVRMNGVG